MTGIIFNTIAECEILMLEINNRFSFLFRGISDNYTHYIKHPDQEKYAVVIDLKSLEGLPPSMLDGLTKAVGDIEFLDETWVDKTELDFYGI